MNSHNISNLNDIQDINAITSSRKQPLMSSMANNNSMNITTTNILLHDNNIFTSPVVAFTNRNDTIPTSNISVPPVLDSTNSTFKLPEPFVSNEIISDSNFQKSNKIKNKNKLIMLNENVTSISSSSLFNQFQSNLENEHFSFNNVNQITENNNTL
eukprot:jgi/Orpsp1_1/1191228/evm.model.d7180000084244.1